MIIYSDIMQRFFVVTAFAVLVSCGCANNLKTSTNDATAVVSVDADEIINTGYIGNGAQWDPYSLDYGNGPVEISDSDWEKIYSRLDHMRPAFIKEKTNGNEYVFNCTERQAENYFFKFGEDAEIISPESLRLWFKDMYKSASMIYEK